MRNRLWITTGLVLALAASGLSHAAQPQPKSEAPTDAATTEQAPAAGAAPMPDGEIIQEEGATEIRANKLIGMPVVNPEGEELGVIEDVVFDQHGTVTGIVLAAGGFLGFGTKPVGITFTSLASAMDAEQLVLPLTGEQIAQAPEFKTKEQKQREAELQRERERQAREQQQQLENRPAAPASPGQPSGTTE